MVMLCAWEGIAINMTMCHRLSDLSTYGLNGQGEGDEHPTYAAVGHDPIYFIVKTGFKSGILGMLFVPIISTI